MLITKSLPQPRDISTPSGCKSIFSIAVLIFSTVGSFLYQNIRKERTGNKTAHMSSQIPAIIFLDRLNDSFESVMFKK